MKENSRVLLICHEYPPVGGGAGVGARDVAVELAKRHEVEVLTAAGPGLPSLETESGVVIRRVGLPFHVNIETGSRLLALASIGSFFGFGILRGLWWNLQRRYDVVFSHFVVPAGLMGIAISKPFGTSHVSTIIEGDVLDPDNDAKTPHRGLFMRAAIKTALAGADSLICISTQIAELTRRYYGTTRPIEIVHYGIVPPVTRPPGRDTLGFKKEEFVVSFVGRLVTRKGIKYLIAAVSALKSPLLRVEIIGDGPERETLEALAIDKGVADRFTFHGRLSEEDKYKILSESDLFAFPSLHEGQGIVLVEAMFYGVALLSTRAGGMEDLVSDGENGFLVEPENASALEEKLRILLADRELTKRLGENGRAGVSRYFIENTAVAYERLSDIASS